MPELARLPSLLQAYWLAEVKRGIASHYTDDDVKHIK